MILLVCAFLGTFLGLIFGGSLRGIGQYALRGIWLPIAAFVLKAGAAAWLAPQSGAMIVCLVQYILLFVFLLLNYRRPVWPLFAFTGTRVNFLVIACNCGCMPVAPSLLTGAGERVTQLANGQIYAYCVATEATHLPYLADIIRIGSATNPLGYASIGDIVLSVGVGILCWQMTQQPVRQTVCAEA